MNAVPRSIAKPRAHWCAIAAITSAYFGPGPALEEIKKHLPTDVPVYDGPDDDDYFAHPPEITR